MYKLAAILGGVLLLVLLAGWLVTWQRTGRVEALYPPVGEVRRIGSVELHFTDQGQGPALILLHGASTNLRDFSLLKSDLLQAGYRVMAVDRPGSGYSTQDDDQWIDPAGQAGLVAELARQQGVDRSIWVGHSLAGSVVMAGLLHHPDQVSAGVMLAGAAYDWPGGVDLMDHLPGIPLLGPIFSHSLVAPLGSLMFDRGLQSAFDPEPPTPEYRQTTGIDLYLRPGQFAATARDIRLLSPYLAGQSLRYGEIHQPVLLIHGDKDDIVPAWNHADRLVKILPDARYLTVAGAGHLPHHTRRGDVARWISEFGRLVDSP
ncbi:MAG: alpha/beta hydrolase [Xanthomonadales bacterium]|nr:alpha/beta hydrolase [Xanthomonadales bacterium]